VWLIAAGGALFALFPQAYASAFSGFYLPFMVVLWLLMFRGVAMELRGQFRGSVWRDLWDAAFSLSSLLLILLFGVSIGNLLRGLPLDANGYFAGSFAFLLNPYALSVGLFAVFALANHGALFLPLRIEGPPAERARALAGRLRMPLLALYIVATVETFAMRSSVLMHTPFAFLAPLAGIGILLFMRSAAKRGLDAQAFAASCAFIVDLLISAAGGMYPYLLPSYPAGAGGLDVRAAAPSGPSLITALVSTVAGLILVAAYSRFVAKRMKEKIVIR
jgi:cytochrome d ubiquinol oxidase subunit II